MHTHYKSLLHVYMHSVSELRLVMSTPSKSIICSSDDDNELRRGPWSAEEDDLLINYIANHGEGRWNLLATHAGLRRTGKSCRLRWLNYLKPDVKRGNLTSEEQLLIFQLHSKWGNRWSKIAQHLPGRTDNEIKNYWRTKIQKEARYLKFETHGSTGFLEFVKGLKMTRFHHKAQDSSPSAMSKDRAIPLPFDGASHYSSFGFGTAPTTQFTCQGGFNFNYLNKHEQNSDSEHSYGSCISSSESLNIPNTRDPLGYTTSQFQTLDSCDFGICSYDGYSINDNDAYDIDAFNLTTTMVAENQKLPILDYQISETNWLNKEFACSTWNMDE